MINTTQPVSCIQGVKRSSTVNWIFRCSMVWCILKVRSLLTMHRATAICTHRSLIQMNIYFWKYQIEKGYSFLHWVKSMSNVSSYICVLFFTYFSQKSIQPIHSVIAQDQVFSFQASLILAFWENINLSPE